MMTQPARVTLFALLLTCCLLAGNGLQAALSLSTSFTTGTQTFNTTPAATEWSTLSVSGAAGDVISVADLDTSVQAQTASGISTALGTVTAYGAIGTAQRNSTTNVLFTQPVSNKATILMATLQNDSGFGVRNITVTYDYTRTGTVTQEEVMGHRAYYSLTGLASSWTAIPAFSGISTSQTLASTITLSSVWATGTKLYLLWADDNGSGVPDTAFTIDNFVVTGSNLAPAVSLTAPSVGSVTTAPGTHALTATASDSDGTVAQVEFLRNGTVISTQTASPYSFSDSGLAAGTYTYSARATDNSGNVTTSSTVDVSVVTDPTRTALQFNGVNRYVTMGAATSTLGVSSFTAECWFKRTGTGVATTTGSGGVTNAIPLVTKGRGEADGSNVDCNYFFGIDATTSKLCADFEAQAGISGITAGLNFPVIGSTVIQNDTWYHAAVTYDTTTYTWKIYLNGVLDVSLTNTTGAAPRNDSIQHFGIGSAMTSTGVAAGFFQGVIDEARVWSVARTPAQILANRNVQVASATTGLLAAYGMNEGSGTTIGGVTATAPAGTLKNNPLWVDGAPFNANAAPSVTLTSPSSGSVAGPATIGLAATASDTDGSVTQVEFLRDNVVISTITASPYTFSDVNVPAGVHTYAARATDNDGAVATTATTTVSVLTNPTKTALLFDGVNDYVTMGVAHELGAGGPPSNGFTIECWFRKEGTGITSTSGSGGVVGVPLFGKGRGESDGSTVDCDYFFGIDTSGHLVADFEAYPATGITTGQNYPIIGTNTPVTNNVWHHAAVTYDGNTFTWTMYLDGVAAGTASAVAGALPRYDNIQHFGIGAALNSTGVPEGAFAGRIDEVRVWNYARSAAQIAATKDYEVVSATGLIGRYGLNEGTGTATASSVGTPAGTLINGPLWVDGAPLSDNTAGTVALTTPADGTTVMVNGVTTLTAEASDTDGVARVEFYAGVTLLGQASTAPYVSAWTPAVTGDYSITAKVYDNLGDFITSAAATVHVIVNEAPAVSLTAPADNTTITAPGPVTLAADASDSDGTISKVEFFANATSIGQATSAPYTFNWTAIPAGDYAVTAKATDNLGAVTTSSSITLHVLPPSTNVPVVSIFSPADGSVFSAPATVNLTAMAADSDGTVVKVEFFNGATKIGQATSAPFTYAWTNVPLGDYTITAKATDDMTATGISAPVTVHVQSSQPPAVTVTAPAAGATGIGSSTSLQLSIADPEGDPLTVTYYGRNTPPVPTAASDFTIVAIPDTQYYSENINSHQVSGSVGANASFFNAQTQWIVDNQATRKIAFVSHMGDIAQTGDTYESEWIVANGAMSKIENPATTFRAHGIPWGVAPGNHDQTPNGDAGGTTNYFTKYFHFTRWDGRPYYGGHFGTKAAVSGGTATPANTNNYELFSAGGLDFIVVHMEYDVRAKSFYQPVLDWADALLKAYPSRRAIITSHWIVNTGNPASFSTQGSNIYNALKNNPNLFLMLCGHVNGEGFRADTYNGHTVWSILQDYQEITNGGNGFLRIYNFSPMNNKITVESYSPTLNRAVTSADGVPSGNLAPIVLSYSMTTPVTDWIPLGTDNVAANGTTSSLSWTGLEAGKDYEWYAAVNDGTTTVNTTARRFSTAAPAAPTVSLTGPANNATVSVNAPINLTATATDSDGTIARVEFFDGGTKLGEATSAPYTFAWSGASLGSHTLTAVVTDNSGLDAISSIASITVSSNTPPTVSLTSPASGAIFQAADTITFTADAADSDGTIAKVEFYAGSTKLGESTVAPFSFAWTGAAAGGYSVTAVATDNSGASVTSAPASISVATATIDYSFTENFNSMGTAGTAPPSGWSVFQGASGSANSTWTSSIPASGVAAMIAAATPLTATTTPSANNNNGYNAQGASSSDRVLASAPTGGAGTAFQLSLVNTTGGAISTVNVGFDTRRYTSVGTANELPGYWFFYSLDNGTTWTNALTNPTITTVPNSTGVTNTPSTAVTLSGPWAGGATLLLRWVDDNAVATSPDQIIGLDNVTITATIPGNVPPSVALTAPSANATFDAPATINLAATASDTDGTISKVEFYSGATLLGQATVAPYIYAWTGAVTGTYTLTAKATDNAGSATTSAPVGITVTNSDNVAPTVSITSPAGNAVFTEPASVTITASAADADGTISKVEFYNGATLLGQATTAPYTYTWTGVTAGGYSLTAKATDNDGGVTTSSAVAIVVNTSSGGSPGISLTQNFDSMGSTGTALPVGWSYYSLSGSHEDFIYAPPATATFLPNSTSTALVVGPGADTLSASNTLTAVTGPTTQKGSGAYNFGLSASSADRCVGTTPSGNSAGEIQWSLSNTTGAAISSFNIGYDIRRFTTTTNNNTTYDTSPYKGVEELPGYWLFYSLDNGATWTNVSALNPTISGSSGVVVPNTVGVTNVPSTNVSLASSWAPGATLLLRWFDDNAESPSPDQILGLDNVTFSAGVAIGTPPTVSLASPTGGATFTAPATVTLTATASDSDGTVSKVEFYNGATLLGQATSSPYTYSWTNVAAGTYSLTAKATDSDNNSTTSSAVSITVNAASGGTSGTLTRGPYLQKASPTAMTVRWRSNSSIVGRVRYGTSAGALNSNVDESAAGTEHEVRLTGLSAATTYFYSVGSANDTLLGDETTTFTTPPVAGPAAPAHIWVLGDAGTGSSNQSAVRNAFYTATGTNTPSMVLQLGDNAYNSGLDTEFQTAVFDMYSAMLRKTPFWSCLGNHETNQATSFVDTYPYFNIYSFPTAGECGGVASGTEHYYSWDYGNIHFISLDSMTASRSATGAMATWLTNDLASTTATWIICIFHHPPYTKGSHNSDTETELIEMRQNILPILESGGVDLVLSGHSHCYERSYLLDGHYGLSTTLTASMKKNGGDGRIGSGGAYIKPLTGPRAHNGTVYCVTGSAGQVSGGSLNHPAHFISLNNLGSTVLDISGTRLDLTFLRENGTTPDTFTMLKQDAVQAPAATTLAATNVTATSATLNAAVNPNGAASTAKFQSGLNTSYGTDNAITLSPNDGTAAQNVSVTLNGLQPGTTYNFRVSATNSGGTTNGSNLTFTTPKLAQAITFAGPPDKTFGEANFDLSATGGGSSSPVTFSVVSGPATISGATVTLTGAGTVTVRASQAGDAIYNAAPDVNRAFTVVKAAQTLTFDASVPASTPASSTVALAATSNRGLTPVTFAVVSGPGSIAGAALTFSSAGAVVVQAAQAGDDNYLSATAQKTITATTLLPVIIVPPQSQVGVIGKPVTFSVTATGAGTLTYQWKRNGVNIANAKTASYTIPTAAAGSVAVYTVEVKNASGTALSDPAELVLVDGIARTSNLAPGGTAVMVVTTVGTGLTYQWSKDGTPLADNARITGSATSRLTMKLLVREDAGSYACTVSKAGIGSHAGGATTLTVGTLKPELAPIDTLPSGAVGQPYSYQVQTLEDQPGQTKTPITKYTAALPAGLTISSTGLISGTPIVAYTNRAVVITATNSAGVSAPESCTITVLPLPANAIGTFLGRFERAANVNNGVGGRLDLTTTATGVFTAKLSQLGVSASNVVVTTGKLVSMVSSGTVVPAGAVNFTRTTGSPLSLSFAFNDATNEITGTLTDPDTTGTAALSGVRNVWNARTNIAASYKGYYTLALDIPAASVGDVSVPQGNGFGNFTVADGGTLVLTGRTADGLTIAAASFVGPVGQFVIYSPYVLSGGSVAGTPLITADAASSFADNTIAGTLDWSKAKPVNAVDRTYKAGFGPISLTAAGAKYTPPSAGEVVMGLDNVDNNATLVFTGGGLATGQSPAVTFSIRNNGGTTQTITLPASGSVLNPAKTTFVLSVAPQGQFLGTFTVITPGAGRAVIARVATYGGMVVRQGTGYEGFGYFLLPQLPGIGETTATAPILSGQTSLQRVP